MRKWLMIVGATLLFQQPVDGERVSFDTHGLTSMSKVIEGTRREVRFSRYRFPFKVTGSARKLRITFSLDMSNYQPVTGESIMLIIHYIGSDGYLNLPIACEKTEKNTYTTTIGMSKDRRKGHRFHISRIVKHKDKYLKLYQSFSIDTLYSMAEKE